MNDILNRLEPLKNPDPSMWVDEAIWCHRLHDEQTPWLVYLEFLNVFCYENSKGRAFTEPDGYNKLEYRPAKRLYLRNILFNNPSLEEIKRLNPIDDDRWSAWFKEMEAPKGISNPDFSYLKEHFHSFEDFCRIVSLLRTTGLETSSNKRWTSKFVFPYGEASLYEDLDNLARTNDRRFFGRTGEVLYLMLCRSKNKFALAEKLKEKVIQNDSVWNSIVKCLQHPDDENDRAKRANAFVPYKEHSSFDALAEDWMAILDLDMPGYDALPHLVCLAGLHLIHYQLTVAAQVANLKKPKIVCEIVAPKKTLVRELSIETYQENSLLPETAVGAYISSVFESKQWKEATLANDPFLECRNLLEETFLWPQKEKDYDGSNDPEGLAATFREAAIRRHRQHVGNVQRNYGREIGLVSRRGTNRLRYAPTDDLLKTLIFATVEKRMEKHLFLEKLWNRYNIVIGDIEGENVLQRDEFDKKAFKANSQRLEQRLLSLGLLRRLSDGCAYVMNPYYSRSCNEK